MADVATASGYAVQTVYFVFHTKAQLFRACYLQAILGKEDPRPPEEQPFYAEMMAATDAATMLRSLVRGNALIQSRIVLLELIAHSAFDEPDAQSVRAEMESLRRDGYRGLIAQLDERFGLRPGVDRQRALDLLLFYGGASTYRALVRESGWPAEEYVDWCTAALLHDLIGEPPPTETDIPS